MSNTIPKDDLKLLSKDPWFKIVEFLQQNWAVIIEQEKGSLVVFYGDTCGVFDQIKFDSKENAVAALKRNGFSKYNDKPSVHETIKLPEDEFFESIHPNGKIYSSGRYWI